MGLKVHYIGKKQQYRSIQDNLPATVASYPLIDGFFGQKGKSRGIREIHSRDHEADAKAFFNLIAKGGRFGFKNC